MTDTTPQTPQDDTESVEDTTPAEPDERAAQDEPDTEHDGSSEDRQAAKLRKRAQAAEAERDQLRDQLEALQRQQVDQQVTAAGIKSAAVWAAGTELAELLAEDGTIDAEAVTAAIERAHAELGVTPVGKGGAPIPGATDRPTAFPQDAGQQFAQAFAPKKHGVVG